jgi:hypothetical protein
MAWDPIGGIFPSKQQMKDLYGEKPVVPDLADVQKKTIATNLAAIPNVEELGASINKFNFEELQKMYRESVPGFADMMQTGGRQINSMLRGELPLDVQQQIKRSSGAKSFSGGFGGSPMAGAVEAQALGLGSLDVIREGLTSAERWMSSASSRLPGLYDVSKMFFNPEDTFNRDWLAAKVEAAPDPGKRGRFDSQMALIGEVLSIYGGGAGYTGKYNANYGNGLTNSDLTMTTRTASNYVPNSYQGTNFGGWDDRTGSPSNEMMA